MITYNLTNKSDYTFRLDAVSAFNPSKYLKNQMDQFNDDINIEFEIIYENGAYVLTYYSNDNEFSGGFVLDNTNNDYQNSASISNAFRSVEANIYSKLNAKDTGVKENDKIHTEKPNVVSEDNKIPTSNDDLSKIDNDKLDSNDAELKTKDEVVSSDKITSDTEKKELNQTVKKTTKK